MIYSIANGGNRKQILWERQIVGDSDGNDSKNNERLYKCERMETDSTLQYNWKASGEDGG